MLFLTNNLKWSPRLYRGFTAQDRSLQPKLIRHLSCFGLLCGYLECLLHGLAIEFGRAWDA